MGDNYSKVQGFFFGTDENVFKLIAVMDEQHCEYSKTTELYILNESVLWYFNYISKKLLPKKIK